MVKDKTSEIFSRLLQAFSDDEAEAVSFYTALYESLVRFFRLKGDSFPEESADITIDRVSAKISQNGNIQNIHKFSFGVARLVFLERLRLTNKEKTAAATFYSQTDLSQNDSEENDPLANFRDCFQCLTEAEKTLLKSYFADLPFSELSRHRERLSRENGISLSRLRLNIFRLREKLESCVKKKKEKN